MQTQGLEAAGRAPRASLLRRVLQNRALPRSVAVLAALSVPEFSVGADDHDGDKQRAYPAESLAKAGQSPGKPMPSAAKVPLAGVRYGGLLAIREATQSRSAVPALIDRIAASSQPETEIAAIAIAPTVRKVAAAHMQPAPSDPLDDAATYAAGLLDSIAAQPGLHEQSAADALPPKLAKPAAIDLAASYAAMTLDRFVEGTASRAEQVAEWEPQADLLPEHSPANLDEAALALGPFAADIGGDVGPAESLTPSGAVLALVPVEEAATLSTAAAVVAAAPVQPASAPFPAPEAAVPAPAPVAAAAQAPAAAPALATLANPSSIAHDGFGTSAPVTRDISAPLAFDLKSQLTTRVDGQAAGKVDFRQTATGLSVRLGSIVSVLSDRFDPGEMARITASAASNAYIPLTALQAQGIAISYDPVSDVFDIGKAGTGSTAAL